MGFLSNIFFQKDKGDFWGNFKLSRPIEASIIETITGENFSLLSNKDAKEKYSSLERLASNNNCPIIMVKDVFLQSFLSEFGENENVLKEAIRTITDKVTEESIRYNIQKTNTASFYIRKWLLGMIDNPF